MKCAHPFRKGGRIFSLGANRFPRWDVGQEFAGLLFVVNPTAVMLHPVANNQPSDSHFYIVPAYLVKNILTDGNMRCLVFDNHDGLGLSIVDNCIATLLRIVQAEGHLVGYARGIIPLLADQEMNEVLANPLFGR